jgi:small GTP-binding protein
VLFKSCGEKGTRAKNGHIGLCSALCTLGYSYTLIRQEQEIICTDLYFLHEAVPDLRDLPLDLGLDSCVVSSYSLVIYPLLQIISMAANTAPVPANSNSIKCVVIGDGAVGKTCMLISYSTNLFPDEHVPTVFDNYQASVMVDGKTYVLGLWDTSGQDDYDRLRPLSYNGADIFILCFAVNNVNSYNNIKSKWFEEKKHHAPDTPFVLVGTKSDLRSSSGAQVVTKSMGDQMCKELGGMMYMECSARTQQGLKQVFDEVIQIVLYNRNGKHQKKKKPKCVIM